MRTEFGTVVVQEDVCNGCGYCVSACPFGVIERREGDGRAWKCTLCYDRIGDGLKPACAKACPTQSIQFGPVDELRDRARQRVDELHEAGETGARLYLEDPTTASAAAARSSCCWTSRRCTGCRRTRWTPRGTCPGCGGTWPPRQVPCSSAAWPPRFAGTGAMSGPEAGASTGPAVRATAMSRRWRPAAGSDGACTAGVSTSGTGGRPGPWTCPTASVSVGGSVVAGPRCRPSGGRGGEQFMVPRARPAPTTASRSSRSRSGGRRMSPVYLFLGGLAGASAVLAGFAQATGNPGRPGRQGRRGRGRRPVRGGPGGTTSAGRSAS